MGLTIKECVKLLKADILVAAEDMTAEIKVACGADLMSDVMAFACTANEMMLTGLVNPQAIRTAEMMDVKVVVFVRGKKPGADIIDLAREMSICLLTTELPMFSACGILYQSGILGKGE